MASRLPEQTLIHFYRAVVGHMDVWRQRMDATTNWAAATAAGMITFAFGTPAAPHFVLLLALSFQGVFLLMESRRYQTFDLWRRRFRTLNRHLVAPVLRDEADDGTGSAALAALAVDLGRTVPHMSLLGCAGFRIRRNYGYLFMVTLVAWVLRLDMLAGEGAGVAEVVAQARIGAVAGGFVVAMVGLAALLGSLLAMIAPSEQMIDWSTVPPPLSRWRTGRGAGRAPQRPDRSGAEGSGRPPGPGELDEPGPGVGSGDETMGEATRIVLAVRVGKGSAAPGRIAAWLASRLGAELTVVYVATELRTVAEGASGASLLPRMLEEARTRAEQWGRDALGGQPFEVVIEEGDVAERVAATAAAIEADLIVAGSEGRGAIQGMVMGDTTREIVRRASCPVVVVPPLAERA